MPDLRAAVVIDYQNLHLMGRSAFDPNCAPHECLVHPLHYGNQLVRARNANQREGQSAATLAKVLVYRGLPSPVHDADPYARNLAQRTEWERDPRVSVTLRPLKYTYERTADGRKATDELGKEIVTSKAEKGVDVLCALALVREARDPEIDLVILASQDTDLEPALDEALQIGTAKVETSSWYSPRAWARSKEIRPGGDRRIWNTRLNEQAFIACRDRKIYR